MSGMIRQFPRSRRILSAAGVVGPLAASAIILRTQHNIQNLRRRKNEKWYLGLNSASIFLVDCLLTSGRHEDITSLIDKISERLEVLSSGEVLRIVQLIAANIRVRKAKWNLVTLMLPVWSLQSSSSLGWIPAGLWMAQSHSWIPTTFDPALKC